MSKAIGLDDSVTTCDCCGKCNLKFTVFIEMDDGEIVHYGQVCAQRNTGKERKVINAEIRQEEARKLQAARAEYIATPEHAAYRARLAERDALPWDSPHRGFPGAADFVREASQAADAARDAIAAKYGLRPYQVYA